MATTRINGIKANLNTWTPAELQNALDHSEARTQASLTDTWKIIGELTNRGETPLFELAPDPEVA